MVQGPPLFLSSHLNFFLYCVPTNTVRVHSGVIHGPRTALFLLSKPLTVVAHDGVSGGDLEAVTEGSVRNCL